MRPTNSQLIFSIVLVLVIVLTSCQTQTPTASPLTATLKDITGTVSIKPAGSKDFVKVTGGETLSENGSIQTGEDGRARLDLSTGTIIRLSPSSLFTLVSNQPAGNGLSTKLKLDVGRLFIILNGGSMDVETPSGVASVRGSYMMVDVNPVTLDADVICLDGHCGGSNDAGNADLTGGQKTILFHRDPITGQYTAPEIGLMTPEDFQKWLDGCPECQDLMNQVYATLTAMAPTEPPATEPPVEPTATNTPEPAPTGCTIIGPLGGSELPKYGLITFAWNAQDGASKYIVTFHYPNGGGGSFETTDTNLQRDMDTVKGGGDYSWDVQAVDNSGHQLCHSQSTSFSKPQYGPDKPPECNPCQYGSGCFDPYNQACGG